MRGVILSKIKNKSHCMFTSYLMIFPTFLEKFLGRKFCCLSKIKNKHYFMFSLRCMLFPTFLVNYLLVFCFVQNIKILFHVL